MNRVVLISVVLVATLFASGCGNRFWKDTKDSAGDTYNYVFDTKPTAVPYHEQETVPLIEINYYAADVLYSNVGQYELSKKSPVYVEAFTNQKNPSDNAIFGHVITEQIADRLVQRGVVITAGQPSSTEYFMPQGVDPKRYTDPLKDTIETLPARAAVLKGTYVIGDNNIYMTAKVIRLDDNAVVSGHNWTIPITDNVRQMIPQLKLEEGLDPTVKTKFD